MAGDIDFFKNKYKKEAKDANGGKDLTAEEIEMLEAKAESDIRNRYMQDADEVARAYERSKARHQEQPHTPKEFFAATKEIRMGELESFSVDIRKMVETPELGKVSDGITK